MKPTFASAAAFELKVQFAHFGMIRVDRHDYIGVIWESCFVQGTLNYREVEASLSPYKWVPQQTFLRQNMSKLGDLKV